MTYRLISVTCRDVNSSCRCLNCCPDKHRCNSESTGESLARERSNTTTEPTEHINMASFWLQSLLKTGLVQIIATCSNKQLNLNSVHLKFTLPPPRQAPAPCCAWCPAALAASQQRLSWSITASSALFPKPIHKYTQHLLFCLCIHLTGSGGECEYKKKGGVWEKVATQEEKQTVCICTRETLRQDRKASLIKSHDLCNGSHLCHLKHVCLGTLGKQL